MKKSKLILIISFVIIIIIVFLLLKKDNIKENKENNVDLPEDIEQDNNEKYVNVPPDFTTDVGWQEFYTVANCISKYIRLQSETKDNFFIPVQVQKSKVSDIMVYKAYGIMTDVDIVYKNDLYFIVKLDTLNKTFEVEKTDSKYSNISRIEAANLDEIKKNENNEFEYEEVNDEYNYKEIFKNMKRLMLAKPEIAYQNLDEDYKINRFGDYEYFKKFVNDNRDRLITIDAVGYKDYGDGNFVLKDEYDNYYEFNVEGVMKYKAKIDNHIFLFDKDKVNYKKLKKEEKVKYNITRWIKMLNSRDYKYAYEKLDDTFKENNYKTQQIFEKFIKTKYPDRYNVSISNIKSEDNIYSAELELTINGEKYTEKYMTVIIRIDEGEDFTISFSS